MALDRKARSIKSAYAQKWNETATGTNASGEPEGAVDVILCPAGPGAAPPLDHARYWGYTSQWNILDYPALVFPVTRADPSPHDGFEKGEFVSQKDAGNFEFWASEPEKYKGAPISLQLVGRRYEDEKVSFLFFRATRNLDNMPKVIEAMEFIKERIGLPLRILCNRSVGPHHLTCRVVHHMRVFQTVFFLYYITFEAFILDLSQSKCKSRIYCVTYLIIT